MYFTQSVIGDTIRFIKLYRSGGITRESAYYVSDVLLRRISWDGRISFKNKRYYCEQLEEIREEICGGN